MGDNDMYAAPKDDITQPLASIHDRRPAMENEHVPLANPVNRGCEREASPAYQCVEHLLTTQYRLGSASDINYQAPNATRGGNLLRCFLRPFGIRTFDVSHGELLLAEDGSGNY